MRYDQFLAKNGYPGSFTQSHSISDQFQLYKGYFGTLNPNFMVEKPLNRMFSRYGQFLAINGHSGSFDAVTE